MTNDKRKAIAARIRALFSKTIANGATEAEAASACAKAKELLDRYQLDLSALELEQEGTEQRTTGEELRKRGSYTIRDRICWSIAEFCEVKSWLTGKKNTPVFFGLASDVDFAEWLLDTLEAFIKKEADRYKLDNMINNIMDGGDFSVPPLLDMNGFRAGCIDRINERLKFEAAKRRDLHRGTDSTNALIIAKSAIVNRDFNKLGLRFGTARMSGNYSRGSGYSAGYSAGERASFGRPVSNSRPLRIGKGD